ncbi:FRIGIDA-like protein 1 [Sesamum alatum]|uniref:FRIGIDA-like protein n=1 Tax=Sesamum alatum TaxID=300844 RepID=A0AAE1YZT9_9LAMI|nr:FRIGIDA-like protein 1 [Sesamum alatum]
MALTTVQSIEKALNVVDGKKENLKKAFEELQSRSSLLSSLDFTWPDLESYFSSIQTELLQKLSTLQALESSQTLKTIKPVKRKDSLSSEPVPARPELKSLCENMDGLGLRNYVVERPKERTAIRVELADAFKNAPDPGSMVLDALEGFWDGKIGNGSRLRTACVVLLEELTRAGVEIGPEVRERALAVALEWKGKMAANSSNGGDGDEEGKEEEGGLETLGYLQLLATYKLLNDGGYEENELIDYVVLIARYRQAVDLCRILGLESKVSDVIGRLINKGKQLLALKFIIEFELTDEFPPVPLLKAYVMDSKKIAEKVRKTGKSSRQSLNDAAMKEISALKSVIKCIEDHGLESQYPKDELVARIEKLEKEKADRKRPAAAPVPKPQQQGKQQKQNGTKRMRAAAGPSAFKRKTTANSGVHSSQPSSVKRAGLLPDHAAPYLSSPSGAYGMAGSLVAAAPYVGSSADLYGLSGAPVGFSGNLNPSVSNPYPSETHAQPGYYDRAIGYGGYDVPPQYHPAYYPQ